MSEKKPWTLTLRDPDGVVVAEYDLGTEDGLWDIHDPGVADAIVEQVRKEVPDR